MLKAKENAVLIALFIVFMCTLLFHKVNYNIDELLSYGLANHISGGIEFDDGVAYTPAQQPWLSYLTAGGGRFDLHHVWTNQASDVHPPLYYLLLYVICFIGSGKFSLWSAGSINIVFAVLTLCVVEKLVYEMTADRTVVRFVALFFIFSAGIMEKIAFLRMYVMLMFWVSLLTLLLIQASSQKILSRKYYGILFLVTCAGTLTHYYFIVYLFFLSLVYGIWLLVQKRYKQIFYYLLVMGAGGALAAAVFPAMLRHILFSGRGVESMDNLRKGAADYLERLKSFYDMLSGGLFGGLLTYIAAALVILWIWNTWRSKTERCAGQDGESGGDILAGRMKWTLLTIPSIAYFLLISKISVYLIDRYIYPIYAVVLTAVSCGIWNVSRIIRRDRIRYLAVGLFLLILSARGLYNCSWDSLIRTTQMLEEAEQYADSSCIYIYTDKWKVLPSYCEVSCYKDVTFYKQDNVELMRSAQQTPGQDLIVIIDKDCYAPLMLKQIQQMYPWLDACRLNGEYGYSATYHLYSGET